MGWYHEPDTARPLTGDGGFFVPFGASAVSQAIPGVALTSGQGATVFQNRGCINFTIAPDPGGTRAKRLAPRRVSWTPDSFIVSAV